MVCDRWSYLQSTTGLGTGWWAGSSPHGWLCLTRKQVCPVLSPLTQDGTLCHAALPTPSRPPHTLQASPQAALTSPPYPPPIIQKGLAGAKEKGSVMTVSSPTCEILKLTPKALLYQLRNVHEWKNLKEKRAPWERALPPAQSRPTCSVHSSIPTPRTVPGTQEALTKHPLNEIRQTKTKDYNQAHNSPHTHTYNQPVPSRSSNKQWLEIFSSMLMNGKINPVSSIG